MPRKRSVRLAFAALVVCPAFEYVICLYMTCLRRRQRISLPIICGRQTDTFLIISAQKIFEGDLSYQIISHGSIVRVIRAAYLIGIPNFIWKAAAYFCLRRRIKGFQRRMFYPLAWHKRDNILYARQHRCILRSTFNLMYIRKSTYTALIRTCASDCRQRLQIWLIASYHRVDVHIFDGKIVSACAETAAVCI